jgi:uncharacterized protein YbgA (DUF1722 family)
MPSPAARLDALRAAPFRRDSIVAFHTAHKFELLAHSPEHYRSLGRLVARVAELEPHAFLEAYARGFTEALAVPATAGKHVNVLEHLAGMLGDGVAPERMRALRDAIAAFRGGTAPREDALALLRSLAQEHGAIYVLGQTYLADST